MAQIEARPRMPTGRPYGGHLGPVADPRGQRAQSGLDVRDARTSSPSAAARLDGRRHGRGDPRAAASGKCRGPPCRPSAPPPIDGLGTTGGFKLIIEDRGNLGLGELAKRQRSDRRPRQSHAGLQGLFNSSRANTPWLYLDIDRTKCMALGVQVSDVFNTLQVYLGSYYVNNFNQFGRTWQVNVQADQRFRDRVRRHPPAPGPQQPGADDPAGHA